MGNEKIIKKFDRQARGYSENRSHPKIEALRKRVMNQAHGKVLEVGIGAGANFSYYDRNNVEVTGVDFSYEMIKHAKRAAATYQINAEFIQADMDELVLEPHTFDCIVSTLTLCSYADPIGILNKFNNWCRKDGKILLMEHGLSSNRLLSFTQKIIDPIYTKFSGCHCDRNIKLIIEESNLQIEHIESHWKDILYVIQAKPVK